MPNTNITIEKYGYFRKPSSGAHTLCVTYSVDGYDLIKLFYSYEQIVAFKDNEGLVVCDLHSSNTTRRHLGLINPDINTWIPCAGFYAQLDEALERAEVVLPKIELHLIEGGY